jgi:hypothetical protein
MKKSGALKIIFIAISILMLISEGVLSYFILINLLPLIAYYYLLKKGLPFWNSGVVKITLFLSGIAFFLFPVGTHIMWLFDIAKTKTGSSTGGLIFIFIPFWAFLFGFLPAIVMLVKASMLKDESEKLQ